VQRDRLDPHYVLIHATRADAIDSALRLAAFEGAELHVAGEE